MEDDRIAEKCASADREASIPVLDRFVARLEVSRTYPCPVVSILTFWAGLIALTVVDKVTGTTPVVASRLYAVAWALVVGLELGRDVWVQRHRYASPRWLQALDAAVGHEVTVHALGEWLGDCVSAPMAEIRTLDQVMADDAARTPQDEALDIPPHEMERIVHDMLTREYTKTLDEPVPALSHKTPRVLACTKAGRVKVADWLKYIENGAAKSGTADPMGTYDFTWMWEELGLSDLRR